MTRHDKFCQQDMLDINELALYLHFPFCEKKCAYCDFFSLPLGEKEGQKQIRQYVDYLQQELRQYGSLFPDLKLKTLYFGGGTPSLLSPVELEAILKEVESYFKFSSDTEISMETNPVSLTEKKLTGYQKLGINRLSLGVQSFCDRELKLLDRLHNSAQVQTKIALVAKYFGNYNLDLMFALPGQEVADWEKSLEQALKFNPPHLSLYNLQYESETPLGKRMERGELNPVTEEKDARMYRLARKKLLSAGYQHYEISNFAQPGNQSRHNKVYWHYRPYLGLGPSSHSFTGKNRFFNLTELDKYKRQLDKNEFPVAEQINLSARELRAETMMMGLRLLKGVSRSEFKQRFDVSLTKLYGRQIEKLKKRGLLTETGGRIHLTEQGLLLGNTVFQEFV